MDLAHNQQQPRSEHFAPGHEPFRGDPSLSINRDEVTGPISFLNPTLASFNYVGTSVQRVDSEGSEWMQRKSKAAWDSGVFAETVEYFWSSRNNRKGRHTLLIREYLHTPSNSAQSHHFDSKSRLTGPRALLFGIRRMLVTFPYRDVSFLNAFAFFMGCLALLLNAFFSFLPFSNQGYRSPYHIVYVEAGLSFLGSAFFLFASSLAFLEAVNAQKSGCFGWEAQKVYAADPHVSSERRDLHRLTSGGLCVHHHSNQEKTFGYAPDSTDAEKAVREEAAENFVWLPGMRELRNYFVYEIGFLANAILLCSSSVYCSASICLLVTSAIRSEVPRWVRFPQIVGALGFVLASVVLMIENQSFWMVPELRSLGWHINLWIAIGSIGLLLCAIFGIVESSFWAHYHFSCSYFWSSWALLIGSVLQWYESLDKYPVWRERHGR